MLVSLPNAFKRCRQSIETSNLAESARDKRYMSLIAFHNRLIELVVIPQRWSSVVTQIVTVPQIGLVTPLAYFALAFLAFPPVFPP